MHKTAKHFSVCPMGSFSGHQQHPGICEIRPIELGLYREIHPAKELFAISMGFD
jgi:hypothetical protein